MTLFAAVVVGWTAAAIAAMAIGAPLPLWRRRPRGGSDRSPDRFRVWLQQAGVSRSPSECVIGACTLFVVALLAIGTLAGYVVAVVPAVAVAAAPFVVVGRRRQTRLSAAQRAWPDALRDILTSVASGQTLHTGLCSLAEGRHGPLSDAFSRYPTLARSIGTAGALEVVRSELGDPVSDRVLEVFVLAAERGGSIVRTILEDLARSISADLLVLGEIDTALLESRINARAVVALPWVALVLLNQGGGPFREFYESPGGAVVVIIGAALTALGWTMVARLGRIPSERRVFAGRPR